MRISAFFMLVSFGLTGGAAHGDDRAIEHAPIGVMGDHYHAKGELMISVRHMTMRMRDNVQGSTELSDSQIISQPNPFAMGNMSTKLSVVPNEMDMRMTMLGLMYAPSDRVTLMGMAMFEDKEMSLTTYQGQMPMMGGNGMSSTSMSMGQMGARSRVGEFDTDSSGLSSIGLSALIRISSNEHFRWHAQIGIENSVGENDVRGDVLTPMSTRKKMILPYGMQSGDDSTSLITAITGVWTSNAWVFGGQVRRDTGLGDEMWQFGDKTSITAWSQRAITDDFSLSLRLNYSDQDEINGRNTLIMAPVQTANPLNYGGSSLDIGIGFNWLFHIFSGQSDRIGVELTRPVHLDLNGPQMSTDWTLNFGYQKSF